MEKLISVTSVSYPASQGDCMYNSLISSRHPAAHCYHCTIPYTVEPGTTNQQSLIAWCDFFLHNNDLIWSSAPRSHKYVCAVCGYLMTSLSALCMCSCTSMCLHSRWAIYEPHHLWMILRKWCHLCLMFPDTDIFSRILNSLGILAIIFVCNNCIYFLHFVRCHCYTATLYYFKENIQNSPVLFSSVLRF